MINQVNTLIYNELCERGGVFLPQVGTLIVQRSAAVRTSSDKIEAPKRKITVTGEQRSRSIVDIIASTANISAERAADIYSQWLKSVTKDGVVTIEGVGVVADRKFTADETLLSLLNPKRGSVKVKRRVNWIVYGFAALCVIFAIATVVYTQYPKFTSAKKEAAVAQVVPEKHIEEAAVVQPEPEAVVVDDVLEMKDNWSYAVWGVYSQKQNALKYKEIIESRYSDLKCNVFHYKDNTMYLLAIHQTPTRKEAIMLVDLLKSRGEMFADVWIFTNKK